MANTHAHADWMYLYVICVILLNINMSIRDTFESDEPILLIASWNASDQNVWAIVSFPRQSARNPICV